MRQERLALLPPGEGRRGDARASSRGMGERRAGMFPPIRLRFAEPPSPRWEEGSVVSCDRLLCVSVLPGCCGTPTCPSPSGGRAVRGCLGISAWDGGAAPGRTHGSPQHSHGPTFRAAFAGHVERRRQRRRSRDIPCAGVCCVQPPGRTHGSPQQGFLRRADIHVRARRVSTRRHHPTSPWANQCSRA